MPHSVMRSFSFIIRDLRLALSTVPIMPCFTLLLPFSKTVPRFRPNILGSLRYLMWILLKRVFSVIACCGGNENSNLLGQTSLHRTLLSRLLPRENCQNYCMLLRTIIPTFRTYNLKSSFLRATEVSDNSSPHYANLPMKSHRHHCQA